MIVVRSVTVANNLDVLDGTDLANIPAMGLLQIFAASTQNDTTLTITGPGSEPVIRNRPLTLRTNGQPLHSDDQPLLVGVVQGGHYVLNVTIVTAATVVLETTYFDLEDLHGMR